MDSTDPNEMIWTAPKAGMWMLGRHVMRPLTPVARVVHPPAFRRGFETGFARLGVPLRTVDEQVVHGAFYSRPVPLVDKPGRPLPPAPILKVLTRLHPEFRRRTKLAKATLHEQSWRRWVDQWYDHDSEMWLDRHGRLQRIKLGELGQDQLIDHLDDVLGSVEDALVAHFELAPIESIAIGQLIVEGGDRWDLTTDDAVAVLAGASPATTAAVRNLDPLRAELDGAPVHSLDDVRDFSDRAAELLDDWLEKHGWWILTGYDLDALTMHEVPSAIVSALNATPLEAADVAPAIAVVVDKVPAADREKARELIQAARDSHALRDAIGPATSMWPLGLARRVVLEIGRRRRLAEPDLATEASPSELRMMATGEGGPTEAELFDRRRTRYAIGWSGMPTRLGEPEPPPPLDSMPEPLALVSRMGFAVLALEFDDPGTPNDATDIDPDVVRGQGIGVNTIRGRARVVDGPRADIQLAPGDVLVARCTTPTWSLLLADAAGLVVEEGGLVAHSAIVARELGIPAVIGASGACSRIQDMAVIELDPIAGTVRRLDH